MLRQQGPSRTPRDAPFAIIAPGKGGNRLIAIDAIASRIGLREGMLLTDATAIEPSLKVSKQDAPGEASDLKRLAMGCRRYSPWTGTDAPEGFWIDITGTAHLFGGEAALLADLKERLQRHGFCCQAAAASTHAAAWGMARFGKSAITVIPPAKDRDACAPLSIRALNIAEDKAALLDRLGLKTVGQLYVISREALRARFGPQLGQRLDQLSGITGEAMSALAYEPSYRSQLDFAEPVTAMPVILDAAGILIARLTEQLRNNGVGAQSFTLTLIDTGGSGSEIVNALARASHDADHICRLFRDRFTTLEGRFDEHSGFDAAILHASAIERMEAIQSSLAPNGSQDGSASIHALFDRLTARLGSRAVTRFDFRQSHIPERASLSVPVLSHFSGYEKRPTPTRPFLLLPHPEPVTALAELPDYPPRRFTWRRVNYRVAKAEGPERIESEWWKPGETHSRPRDYYTIEEEGGRRFWLYREGLYADPAHPPKWFMHGMFA